MLRMNGTLPVSVIMAVFHVNPSYQVSSWFSMLLAPNRTFVAQTFYGPDVPPVTQPTVSMHRRKHKALTQPVAWPHPFFIHHWSPEESKEVLVPLCGLSNTNRFLEINLLVTRVSE